MRESGYTEDANSAITAARHAEYQVIAEWAREVALEDAAQINAIRALRSGTADTNPKEDDRG
jgi:uncharacterized protein YdbL (DUF1318 family)